MLYFDYCNAGQKDGGAVSTEINTSCNLRGISANGKIAAL
ncbi:hypothetical protein TrispH2_003956 [Trichoplax sp. H2]|nr:hypothetical protein TrispH2_003956 [Trichoplax sp. H2]|eukprot:RDD43397.1 hypothetical protein TrispH2_003956 [Trichoplax sp. H2]